LLATIDQTAAGSLHRRQLALEADGRSVVGYDADDWLSLAYDQAADWLHDALRAAEPLPLIEHAE